jgi:hypothetical protein
VRDALLSSGRVTSPSTSTWHGTGHGAPATPTTLAALAATVAPGSSPSSSRTCRSPRSLRRTLAPVELGSRDEADEPHALRQQAQADRVDFSHRVHSRVDCPRPRVEFCGLTDCTYGMVWYGMVLVWCPSYPLDRNRCDQVAAAGSGAG